MILNKIAKYAKFKGNTILHKPNIINLRRFCTIDPIDKIYSELKSSHIYSELHDRDFEIFLTKLDKYMNKEKRRIFKVKDYIDDINKLAVVSREPLKEILASYSVITTDLGFDPQVLSNTCLALGKAYNSREKFHRVYTDYNEAEILNSYRMYYLIEDLKYAITNNHSYFTAEDLAMSLNGLRLLNFKSTELVELISDKLYSYLNKIPIDKKYERYSDIPGAGRYKFMPINQYAPDIINDVNFKSHIDKLMKIEEDSDNSIDEIREVINYLRDTKELKFQLTDTIDNLLDQYIKIEQSILKNPDFANNPYIKYEIFKLQDKLMESGFLKYDDLKEITNKKFNNEEIEKFKQIKTTKILKDFVAYNFPDLFTLEKLDNKLEKATDYKINESNYKIDALSYGKVLLALSEYCKINYIDMHAKNDFHNEKIKDLFSKYKSFHYEYTKIYDITESIFIKFESNTIDYINSTEDYVALGYILLAINSINYNNNLSEMIVEKMSELKLGNANLYDIINTLVGLARSPIHNIKTENLIANIANKIAIDEIFKIEDIVMVLWSLASFKLYKHDKFIQLYDKLINSLNLKNYVSYKSDIYYYQLYHLLKCDYKDNKFFSPVLESNEDPIKDSIIDLIKNNLFFKERIRQFNSNLTILENLPFNPNLIFGYYGYKIALFIKDRDYMSDKISNGLCYNIKRLLIEKHNTYAVFLSKKQLLEFNLNTLHFNIKNDIFNFGTFLNHEIDEINNEFPNKNNNFSYKLKQLDISINNFIKTISQDDKISLIIDDSNSTEKFLNSLNELLDINNETISVYLPSMLENKITDIKICLFKIEDYYKNLSKKLKEYLNETVNKLFGLRDFNIFIKSLISTFSSIKFKNSKSNQNWFGKRIDIDLISDNNYSLNDKNISVELLDNNFMWLTEYNSYSDWEEQLRVIYDNFNYFIENKEYKYLFNSHKLGNRHVPSGIFPHPFNYRKIRNMGKNSFQAKNSYENELKKYKDYNKYLIECEIEKNNNASEIPIDISMKVNLLNIKNALKQNLNDNQIIKFISEFEFVDLLIAEQIEGKIDNNKNPTFVSRDHKSFVNFYKKLSTVRPLYDQYDKTVMKEYYKEETLFDFDTEDDLYKKMKKKYDETIDDDALSIFNPNTIDYKFNINEVMASYTMQEYDQDINSYNLIDIKRKKSQRNLILLKICSKLLRNMELTINEVNYLKYLKKEISSKNINTISDSGLNNVTKLTINDLNANDLYMLNTLPNVQFDSRLGNFSLSDIILEVSHFIDNSTINKILHEIYFQISKNKLEIESDSIFNIENKEPTLISNEIKENLWRIAGHLNEEDIKIIRSFLRIKRGKGKFDDIWLKIDELSLDHFIKDINNYEDRLVFLGKWIKRKEKEIENRINLPNDRLLSDKQINKIVVKRDKVARKEILKKIFNVNDVSEINRIKLSQFTNEFCTSLYMFNFEYPNSILDIYYALLDLDINVEDRNMMECYRKFFLLDEYDGEILSIRPLEYKGEKLYKHEDIEEKVKKANIEFVKPLVDMILNKI